MAYSTPSDQLGTLRIKADESEDYFRRVFENAATGIVIADANRGYLAVNDRFCAITGYDRETLLTMGCHQLVHPDDQAADIAEVERLVRGEATSFNRELRYIHANGSTVPVIVNVSVLKSDARERVRILAVVEDITERKQMEEALLESEKKYRTLVEQSDDGIAIVRDGVLVYVNPRLASLYGGTVELLTGSQVTDHLDAKDMQKVTEMRRRRLNGEEVPSRYEVALKRRNGQIFQAELNVGMIIYQGRSAAQMTIRDITERKLAEEAVKREKKLQEGINRILQEAITCDTEEQLGIVCLSVAGELTKSRIGFIGEIRPDGNLYDIAMSNPTWELCAMYDQSGHRRPPGQFALHGLYGYVLQQGKSLLTNTPAQHPQSIGIPKGHPPLSSFLGVPLTEAGKTVGLVAVGNRDGGYDGDDQQTLEALAPAILQSLFRKRAEDDVRRSRDELEQRVTERTAQLQASEELTRQHLAEIEGYYNVAPIGLAILDRQLRHIRVNEKTAQMDGVPVEDHIGRTLREVAPKNVADWFEAIAPRVLNDGDTITGVEITGGSGLEPDVERMGRLSCFPLRNAMSQIVGVGCTLEDITETRRLEEELRQSHKMEAVGTLAGGIAHDFNNMLAIIMGNAELALDDVQQPEPRRNLEAILGASKRSRDLVKQILAFSRKTGGEQKTLDMGSLLKEIHTLLRSTLPTTIRIKLDIDAARNLIVLGDPTKIQQVILNLAGNAVHAMRKHGGVLTIGLSTLDLGTDSPSNETESGPYVKLTVKDTGTGIPDEIRRRIFEPFFTTKEPGQGTGMGLSVVYGIVKDLNGMIEVESKVGRGTLFTVLFPQAHVLAPKQEHEVATPSGKEHILLVDDEAGFLEVTAMMLKRLGYRVTSTHDSVIAMRHFITSPEAFDLIITDQTMPDFTGIEFAQEVRCIRKNLPIILCTGHSDIVSPETAKEAGIEGFLMKPIRKKELAQAIRRVLGTGKTVPVEHTTFQS